MDQMEDGYYDLGTYSRSVTTDSAEAQLWFDRGLNWLLGFNHGEAIACFERAIEADPNCAMAHWGVAIGIGPNYNMAWDKMDPVSLSKALGKAFDSTQVALGLAGNVTPPEAALIEALPSRYPQRDPIEDQMPWNKAFTNAMREVAAAHPDDLEIQAVFVDAILNETPWKMWDLQTGQPAEDAGTVEAQRVLERAFAELPGSWDHPGLLHLYVHLMEMSPTPEAALRHGDRLREMMPQCGHLIHMPTHIDVLCGNYHDVVHWNQKAVVADRLWFERQGMFNVWTLYANHNQHFVIYGAMFAGQYEPAMAAADELIATIPEDFLRVESPPFADAAEAFIAMRVHVLVRFGKWQELIDSELPADTELYSATTAITLYAKAVAHSALGNIDEAEAHKARYIEARDLVPETRRVHNNTVVDLLQVADEMLDGELEYRRGNHDVAFAHLRRAVEIEDALDYDEPWGWMQPTRHALGALLLEQQRYEEAEAVYRADLGLDATLSRASQHPNNIWSLFGLHECLSKRGETVESLLIKQQLDLAAARADIEIKASCYCHQAAMAATSADDSCCD
ncbi:MAG: tetratricopeptide repeat protein [Acidimicrobiales bacterium]